MKNRKKIFLILFLTFIIIGSIFFIKHLNYKKTAEYKLKEKGYQKKDIDLIVDKLEGKQVELIVDKEYNDKLLLFIDQQFFIKDKLDKYLSFQENNEDSDIASTISIVNAGADKDFYTEVINTDTSKDNLLLVNKYYQLEKDFKFDDIVPISQQYAYAGHRMRKEVHDSYISMWHAAKEQGYTLIVNSSYRDYDFQQYLYDSYKNRYGEEKANTFSAKPGHSEHQTGLALDIVTYGGQLNESFADTEEYEWLKENAHLFGFIVRYPKDKTHITGYAFEPWHYRYVGKDVAKMIKELNITFDEYYELYIK